jgi:glycosyltransferase involved in cell wall biosynthesis
VRVLHIQKVSGLAGSERHLLQLLPGLAARGLRVRMCVLGTEEYVRFSAPAKETGIDTRIIASGYHINPMLIGRLAHQIQSFRPDIVHTHLIHADVYGQIAARIMRVPAISTMHATHKFYRREPYRSAAKIAGHLAHRVIAISDHVSRFASELRLASTNAIRVIPYGIDGASWDVTSEERAQSRKDLGLEPNVVAIGVASRLFPHKGHGFLIDAMEKIAAAAPHARLLVAGDGPLFSELADHARRVAPSVDVKFLGFVRDIRRFMAACDIIVFPSMPAFGEGFGLAALEAMAAGRPVVATAVDSLVEVVTHGESGLLVTPGNVQELADALLALIQNRELRERLGQGGRERAIRFFPWDRVVERTIETYQEVLPEGPTPLSPLNGGVD